MITDKDIDEALTQAEVEVDESLDEALREYYRPDVEREAAMLWATLPEPIKAMVRMRNPELAKMAESR